MGKLALSISILCAMVLSCSTDPSEPEFLITSVEFTGDSTVSEVEPFLEFTLHWESPAPETSFQYTVYRSDSPGIQSDPSEARVLATLPDWSWSDSTSLEWGKGYYYTIVAESPSGSSRWSNEAYVITPVSPFPAPVLLSFERQLFYFCNLEWSEYTGGDDFRWYILYRSTHPGIEQNPSSLNDTLFITDNREIVAFCDTLVPGVVAPKYYALAVVDSSGLRSFSNEVCFEPGAEFPWRFFNYFEFGADYTFPINDFAFVSYLGDRMYLSYRSSYTMDAILSCKSTLTGGYVGGISKDDIYSATERPDGTILVCFGEDSRQTSQLSVFTHDLTSELQTVPLDRIITRMVETEAGVLCSSGGKALLLDPVSLQTVDSIPYSFTSAVVAEELDRVFLCRNSYTVCLRNSDLAFMGNIIGDVERLVCSQDGVLFCIGDTEIRGYDPISLTLQSSYQLPENTLCSTVFSSGEHIVYVFRNYPYRVEVFSYDSGEFLGLISEISSGSDQHCFICDPQGEFLWFLSWYFGNGSLSGNKIII